MSSRTFGSTTSISVPSAVSDFTVQPFARASAITSAARSAPSVTSALPEGDNVTNIPAIASTKRRIAWASTPSLSSSV